MSQTNQASTSLSQAVENQPSTSSHHCRHRTLAAFARALADQFALEFGDSSKQSRQQPALGATGIPQWIAERPERRASLADTVDKVEQFPRRPATVVG
jgi:hypothetical protein